MAALHCDVIAASLHACCGVRARLFQQQIGEASRVLYLADVLRVRDAKLDTGIPYVCAASRG